MSRGAAHPAHCAPALAYSIGGLGSGIYTGSGRHDLAFIGVGALYTFVIDLITRMFSGAHRAAACGHDATRT